MSIRFLVLLLSSLMLMSFKSILILKLSFLITTFTLPLAIVNVGSFSTRAYISQCKGKQLLNPESQSLMSIHIPNSNIKSLMLMSFKSIVPSNFQFLATAFTLPSAIVNVGSVSRRAYISQCRGK